MNFNTLLSECHKKIESANTCAEKTKIAETYLPRLNILMKNEEKERERSLLFHGALAISFSLTMLAICIFNAQKQKDDAKSEQARTEQITNNSQTKITSDAPLLQFRVQNQKQK